MSRSTKATILSAISTVGTSPRDYRMRLSKIAKNIALCLVLLALAAFLIAPVMSIAINSPDFKSHYYLAIGTIDIDYINHQLFHETVRFYHELLPSASREHISLVTALTFLSLVPLPIFWQLRRASRRQLPNYIILLLTLGLMITTPILLWTDNKYLLGYFNPVVYHSPTMAALRPFLAPLALLSLLIFERQFALPTARSSTCPRSGGQSSCSIIYGKAGRWSVTASSAALLMLATSAKPSYTIALIPGLCLFAIFRYRFHRSVDWALLTIGFVLPACLALGALYLSTYINLADGSSIGIGFLTVLAHHVPLWRIPFQILLSIVFPAAVYLLYRVEARRHLFLNLSWVIFVVGALISLTIYEGGPRLTAGNFLWTSYIAVFVLMFATLSFLVERYSIERELAADESDLSQSSLSFRFIVAMLLFGLHVISGLRFYIQTLSEF